MLLPLCSTRCREGYQGIRCDQFLPKTDSILSDPNHLGIEFMESKEVYKRQVLSITSIAMAISLLGTLCMALYCRNKRRREKLHAHLKESRSLKNYTANCSYAVDGKTRAPSTSLQMHEYCRRPAQPRPGNVSEPGFRSAKHLRSGSLSHSPDQRTRAAHWSAQRRTPPTARGRLNPIGSSKYSGPAYQHLQEGDSTEKESDSQRGCQMQGESQRDDPRRDAILHMQTPVSMETAVPSPWRGRVEVRSHPCVVHPATRSLRRPGRQHSRSPPPPFRSCSIPIIPSVQCHHDNEAACMQTSLTPAATVMSVTRGATPCEDERRERARRGPLSSSSLCSAAVSHQQDEVELLLKEAQEQLRALALAHRKQEDSGISSGGSTAALVDVKETVCFLNPYGGSAGVLSCTGPTQTQLLSPSHSHRDMGPSGQ
ncbi:pro-neuregulin-3, membrane-bound isoform [Betta splendens]|uniref:Pro-neuregulin-3, membrane-bound isoform n=1 Tax=Betta splendens TaxID=158456 RepID=A0A8M1H3B5_BETSP|nr:pro-neuregulin-3, membrane-bound isoform [Betta splendens]